MSPKVTVLLAVKDGEPYVRRCLESVLGQTFRDFELLVVDDGSADATAAIVESLADERVRLLRNERNLGQVPSLNRGLREARGEYVARIDADDWCLPERLERQVAVLDGEPAVGLVGTWMDSVDPRGRVVSRLRSTIGDYAEFVYHTLIMRVYVSHPSAMYRREPVLALGGYDEATGPAEDKDLWRRLALERWDARIVPSPLVVYSLHDAQLSQTRAAYQREVDGESQDRFLRELAPGVDVRPCRLLLADDPRLWREDAAAALRALDAVLAGAAERLRLDDGQRTRLDQLVGLRLAEVASRRPWRRAAQPIAAAGLRRLPPHDRRRAAAGLALRSAAAPLQAAAAVSARAAARAPALRALRAPLRRAPATRRLYSRLTNAK